jgi:acetolactate synthase I/II/III large subunit
MMGTNNQVKMSVSDYIAEFLMQINCRKVHGLVGGGAAGLNDGFIRHPDIEYHCYHHEQSAGYAALGEARLKKRWSIINPTTGCGGTNCYTPVLNAWQDSLPIVVISGNVNLSTCSRYINSMNGLSLRAYGVQEHDIVESVKSITKYAELLTVAEDIPHVLASAFVEAASGRKGPSWIDVPADLQHEHLATAVFDDIPNRVRDVFARIKKNVDQISLSSDFSEFVSHFEKSVRPLVLIGSGVANDLDEKEAVKQFIKDKNLPVVATYGGTDVLDHEYDMYLGAVGIKGNRAANFATQNCDFLLVLGSRLPFAVIGYDVEKFAQHAKIFIVDLDEDELAKNTVNFPSRIHQVNGVASQCLAALSQTSSSIQPRWKRHCIDTKLKWEIIVENKSNFKYSGISIYHVMEELNKPAYDHCNFVVDAGSISYVAPTALRYNITRKFIFSPGQADMGCALPTALGVAANSSERTICVTGDGSFLSNVQELATLSYHNYNLTLVVLNNQGYLSISNTQKNNYGEDRVFGEHLGRGLTFPDYEKLCDAFNLRFKRIDSIDELSNITEPDLKVIEVACLTEETIAPYQARINSRQAGAHDMAPFKDKDELIEFSSTKLEFAR